MKIISLFYLQFSRQEKIKQTRTKNSGIRKEPLSPNQTFLISYECTYIICRLDQVCFSFLSPLISSSKLRTQPCALARPGEECRNQGQVAGLGSVCWCLIPSGNMFTSKHCHKTWTCFSRSLTLMTPCIMSDCAGAGALLCQLSSYQLYSCLQTGLVLQSVSVSEEGWKVGWHKNDSTRVRLIKTEWKKASKEQFS